MRLRWLLFAFFLVLILAVSHGYILLHSLYFYYWWLDIPMHLLGGFSMGILYVALFGRPTPSLFILFIVIIAFGWEVFEYLNGLALSPFGYWFDTSLDVFDDLVGALLAYLLSRPLLWHSA